MHLRTYSLEKKKRDFFLFLLRIAFILMRLSSAHSNTQHTRIDSCERTNYTVVL